MSQQTKIEDKKINLDEARGKRVRKARDSLKLHQDDLAEMAGITQGAIVKIEKGHDSKYLYKIAECLKVDLEWIMTGKGKSPFPENMKDVHASIPRGEIPVIEWGQVDQWVNESETPITFAVNPIGLAIPLTIKNPRDIFALRIKNDVMVGKEMQFKPGTFILVDRRKRYEFKSGSFVICQFKGQPEAMLREYVQDGGKEYLKPLNQNYRTDIITDREKLLWFGAVIEFRGHI